MQAKYDNDYKFLEFPPENLPTKESVGMIPATPLSPKDNFRVWTKDCGGIYSRDFQSLTDACVWLGTMKATLPSAEHKMLPIIAPCPWEISDAS